MYNQSKYSVQKELNMDYTTQTYSADISYTTKSNFTISSDFDYYINNGLSEEYNQSLPIWNAYIAQQVFKKKNGEIKFSVNDILNQNQSISRTARENYVEDTRSLVIQRYFLLTFTYNLNRAGAPQRGQQQGGQGPRQFQQRSDRMMRQ